MRTCDPKSKFVQAIYYGKPYLILFMWLCIFSLLTQSLQAATHVVANMADLQTALDTSAANGEDDTILIQAGTYTVSATLTFVSMEDFTLTISGVSSSQTILDGGSSVQVMNLEANQNASHITVTHLGIQHGQTLENGGGLAIMTDTADISIENCAFSDNTTNAGESIGGGASLFSGSGTVTVSQSSFHRNHSFANVGGLSAAVGNGTVHIANNTFQDNTVNNTGGSTYYGDGGGAMLYSDPDGTPGGHIVATGNTFQGNTTTGGDNPDGGGLMVYQLGTGAIAEVLSNTFTDNTAGLGGGGCIVRINGQGTITFSQNQLTGNEATLDAGGGAFLYLDSGSMTCEDNTFTDNLSGDTGAGAWIMHDNGTSEIRGNRFFSNDTVSNGGGANIYIDTAVMTIERNVFAENTAGNSGGGLSYSTASGSVIMNHNTFYDNTAADGGALYCYYDSDAAVTTIRNHILWGNHTNEFAYSYGSPSSPIVVITYSNVMGLPVEPWAGMGCIDQNPLFANAAGRDFQLTWISYPTPDVTQSPCIDTGDPASPLDPDGTQADMGAFTYTQFVEGQPTFTRVSIFCRQDTTSQPATPIVLDPDPGDTHTFEVLSDPLHGDIEPTLDETQLFLSPNAGFVGSETFNFRAIDPLGLSIAGIGEILVEPDLFFTNLTTWPSPNILFFIPYINNPNQ